MLRATLFPIGLLALFLLAGCATPLPPGAEPGPNGTMAYNVLIEASEPGARIEAEGNYVGETPVTLKIFGDPDGTFHDFGSSVFTIRALPVSTNQYPQSRVFRTGQMLSSQDRIPQRIYFDMNTPAPVYVPVPVYVDPAPPVSFGTTFYFGPRYHHGYGYGHRYYHRSPGHGHRYHHSFPAPHRVLPGPHRRW